MSDQLFAEAATFANTQHSQETDIHALHGIRNSGPAIKRPQTYVLDRNAIEIGMTSLIL
jgi:hypothetical protein